MLKHRRPIRIQKGYFTGTVHPGSRQEERFTALLRAPRFVDFSGFPAVLSHLWYVMEKARLVLVREKRALATPLDAGSQVSVTPVSTATKSAGGERVGQGFRGSFCGPLRTHRCGSPPRPPPQSSGRNGRCRTCGGRPPSLCLSQGSNRSFPAQSLFVFCRRPLEKDKNEHALRNTDFDWAINIVF